MKQLEFTVKRSRKQFLSEESSRRARQGMTEHQWRVERLVNDLNALESIQAARPLKPPGK